MRWRRVDNPDVIDMRGRRGPGGGGMRIGGGVGAVGILIVLALQLLGGGGGGGGGFGVDEPFGGATRAPGGSGIPASQDPERDLKDFSAYVFTRAQETWEETFRRDGEPYRRAKLVLFRGGVETGCGSASSAIGPFYCPADQRVYLDLSFYRDMTEELGAGGDFAWAYVIAHEMGHHVQKQLGTSDEVHRLQRERRDDANELSVRLELQADCYSGVWARSAYDDLEEGDVEEAIRASEAIGDDRLQRRAGGEVDPDSFTHGSSEQRKRWFDRGRSQGTPAACDTFNTTQL